MGKDRGKEDKHDGKEKRKGGREHNEEGWRKGGGLELKEGG